MPSKKSLRRAGWRLRDWWLSTGDASREDLAAAELVWAYRQTFQPVLNKVTVGVRQFVDRESDEIVVSQRLKRMSTIIDKLARHPTMQLTTMEDIGGCRAILRDSESLDGVFRRIRRNWIVIRVRDYEREPKLTGYRAVHVVVERDGLPIEIQLRTPSQHAWAAEVERTGARLGLPALKDGEGPPELVRYFERAAVLLSLQESGEDADEAFMTEFQQLRGQVARYFARE